MSSLVLGRLANFFVAAAAPQLQSAGGQVPPCPMAKKEAFGRGFAANTMHTFAIDTGIFVAGAFLGVVLMCLIFVSRSDD
ncbi:DUF3789 domain-containing protein [Variovorax paradoxus]|uniref:DUF3789 domain-containing protein n=1 Tax=Variovorax paradoxus TaxID=34073 RepID=UPI002856E9AA|nr:DUF3789 domain-containing protein [Variovorax paradoxus]MDR6454228.1 hypothetical protein [Variovorax paradoxus]